jgi:hypothetical protein
LHCALPKLECFDREELPKEGHLIQDHLLDTFLDVGFFADHLRYMLLVSSDAHQSSLRKHDLAVVDFELIPCVFESYSAC